MAQSVPELQRSSRVEKGESVSTTSPLLRAGLPAPTSSQEDFVAYHVGDSIQTKPVPVTALRRGGPRPLRVLMFGGGPLIGWGLRDHNQGLAGHVANQLAADTRRGVEMDVVADAEPVRPAALDGIRGLRLWRYDAVVAVLGQPSQKGSPSDHAYWASELVRTLLVEGNPAAALLVYEATGTEPVSRSLWARPKIRLGQVQRDAAERACARTGRVRFDDLTPPRRIPEEGRPFDSLQFEEWADLVVERLLQQFEHLRATQLPAHAEMPRPDDERFRQRALDSLRIGKEANPHLERLVNRARELYGATGAAINIIDNDQQWSKVAVPVELDMPRSQALCNHAIQVDRSTLINDTRLDERLADNPLTGQIRFYAAHPIRSWDGYRIGTLCVYGREPRRMRPSELDPLRDLAGLVEQELWSDSLKRHARSR
jgi:hypothetical protein